MTATDQHARSLKDFAIPMIAQIEAEAHRDDHSFDEVLIGYGSEALQERRQSPELLWVDVRVAGSRSQPPILVHAWGVDEHQRLHLASTLMPRQGVQEENLPYVFNRRDISDALQRMLNLAALLKDGHDLPDATAPEVLDMIKASRRALTEVDPEVVLHLFTPGHYRSTIPALTLPGVVVAGYVHDIEWLRRVTEGDEGDQLNLRDHEGGGLPCLVASHDSEGEPDVILAVISGEFLAGLYDRRGDELLRRNVRIYLRQNRRVNREIAASARSDPARFIALNNGISAVAAGASFNSDFTRIETIDDLQIVNGGQTTATLHEVWLDRRNPVDLSVLKVQAKITIVRREAPDSDDLAQNIALAANSQNRITAGDLLSGDPLERSLEEISRKKRYVSDSVETGWYYERVRGQHAGLLATDRKNERVYPSDQVLEKAYAAQLKLAWSGLPHRASMGREKALKGYKDDLKHAAGDAQLAAATEQDFDRLVGLAVIRREADGPIAAEGTLKPPLGFYLLAWLAEHMDSDIDLFQIARTGVLPDRLIRVIQQVTPLISGVMRTHPAAVPHEGERPKRKECWEAVRLISLPAVGDDAAGLREFTRQDWQAALVWAEGKRNKALREKILRARKLVQTGKAAQNRKFLLEVMQEAADKGFRGDMSRVAR